VLITVGILLLAFLDEALTPLGATLISISNTFAVGLLWFSTYDMARHISVPSYVILGVSWFVHILPREMGRVSIWLLEPSSTKATVLIAFILFVLAVAIVFLLNDSIPKTRPFFSEFRTKGKPDLIRDKVVNRLNRHEEARSCSDGPGEREPRQTAPDDDTTFETNLASLGKRYYLTEREQEVVRLLAQGRSRIAIAQKLYLSENTVRTYVKSVYSKLDIHSKQDLIDHLENQR
jgi:DNA-binding CsgD family transcriptional regulator